MFYQLDEEKLLSIVRQAGAKVRTFRPKEVTQKEGAANFVTECDRAVEEFLHKELQTLCPEAHFMGEETGGENSGLAFVVDPIDGTTNFIHDLHLSAISVALCVDGKAVLGAVYNPYADELFFAKKDGGASLNGAPIHVSDRKGENAVIGVGSSPYNKAVTGERTLRILQRIFMQAGDFRRLGSAAIELCSVACGRLDGYYEMTLSPWDHAAAGLILTEAGGKLSRMNGDPLLLSGKSDVLAANPPMYPVLLQICREA